MFRRRGVQVRAAHLHYATDVDYCTWLEIKDREWWIWSSQIQRQYGWNVMPTPYIGAYRNAQTRRTAELGPGWTTKRNVPSLYKAKKGNSTDSSIR